MAKFLEESHLRDVFRERYLRIHDSCLKSISDLLATAYGRERSGNRDLRSREMIDVLARFKDPGIVLKDPDEAESPYFRNLRNAWYHEFALRNTNMQIAAWKIIQTYYSVYCSVSAVVRCFKLEGLRGHRPMLIEYGDSVVRNPKLRNSLLPPTNLFFDGRLEGSDRIDWKYGLTSHVPNVEMGLKWAREKATEGLRLPENKPITVPIYLHSLREWVNYSDPYLFLLMYGKSVRSNLEYALEDIAFAYLTQTEYFLALVFGWPAVRLQFEKFIYHLKDIEATAPYLQARHDALYHFFE